MDLSESKLDSSFKWAFKKDTKSEDSQFQDNGRDRLERTVRNTSFGMTEKAAQGAGRNNTQFT